MSLLRFVDSRIIKILRVLILHKSDYLLLQMISNESFVPLASTFRIIHRLVTEGIVVIKPMGKLKTYRLGNNLIVKEIIEQLK